MLKYQRDHVPFHHLQSVLVNSVAAGLESNGVDLSNFLVAELAKSFGFPFKNRGAESLDDFRYALS